MKGVRRFELRASTICRRYLRPVLFFIMWLVIGLPSIADLADGQRAYLEGDYATALKEFQPLAEAGDAEAQYALGVIYDNGRGVPQDDGEAIKWYRLAAKQGIADAQFNLGVMHAMGEGASQDYGEAVKWYRRAAEQGDAEAQHALGVMYDTGRGVLQDYVEAHKWFNLAAAQNHEGAAQYREQAAKQMTSAQIAEAQQLARQWTPPQLVWTIQTKLHELGYDPGPIDGKYGKRTAAAIRKFQRAQAMRLTGKPSIELRDALDLVAVEAN